MMMYTPKDWYWIVAGDDKQVYSSARSASFRVTANQNGSTSPK